jgi:hypothetical protein
MRSECVAPHGPSEYTLEGSGPEFRSSSPDAPQSPASAQAMLETLGRELSSLPEEDHGKADSE